MSIQFQQPIDHYGHEMNFLKNPITIKLHDTVELKKSKYSLEVRKISKRDMDTLNSILVGLIPNLKVGNTYFNSKSVRYFDKNMQDIDFSENKSWYITVTISGYKKNTNGVVSPIWRIQMAVLS